MDNGSTVNISFSTIAGNSATFQGGNLYGATSPNVGITASILANGSASSGPDAFTNAPGTVRSGGSLYLGTGAAGSGISAGAGDVTGAIALNPLANYGSPTQTMQLPAASPLLNVVTGGCPGVDQRGTALGASCAPGAYL